MFNSYSILIGMGAALGLWLVATYAPPGQAGRWVNAGLLTLLGCLVGARLVYVLFHIPYYSAHPGEMIQVWQGGLAWAGALFGGAVVIAALAWEWHMPFSQFADHLVPLIPPLAVSAWLGCWSYGCGYGPEVSWGLPGRGEGGVIANRFPLQFLAAITLIVYFLWLERLLSGKTQPGARASLTLFGSAFVLLIFSLLWVDPSPLWGQARPDTWIALGISLASLLAWLFVRYIQTARGT